jgi:hypothetical protein
VCGAVVATQGVLPIEVTMTVDDHPREQARRLDR